MPRFARSNRSRKTYGLSSGSVRSWVVVEEEEEEEEEEGGRGRSRRDSVYRERCLCVYLM